MRENRNDTEAKLEKLEFWSMIWMTQLGQSIFDIFFEFPTFHERKYEA